MDAKTLDTDFVRGHFPGLSGGWTFFDNAGGTQILSGVVERINEFLLHRNVQIGGSYEVSRNALRSLEEGREAMRDLINARRAEEIVFAPSTTVALQNLARSIESQLRPGDEVVVTISDHESNIGPWARLERAGVNVRWWRLDSESLELDLADLDALMNTRTRLVAVTHVSNILGTVNPIAEIARRVHEAGALICVDSVAFAPHRALDVQDLDVDFLAFSQYKVFGAHHAVLYARYEQLAELDGLYHYFYGKDKIPAKLEPGNANYELAYGGAGIVDYLASLGEHCGSTVSRRQQIEAAFEAITAHEALLGERLLEWLRGRPDCRIIGLQRGDLPNRVPTISFKPLHHDAGELTQRVDAYRIAVRFGDFHARRLIESLGLADNGGVVRVSMAHYNTVDEVDGLIEALEAALG